MDEMVTISGRKFSLSVRGYDQDEVDGFLRMLAARLDNGADPAVEAARIAGITRFPIVTLGYARDEVHEHLHELRLSLIGRAGEPIVSVVAEPPKLEAQPEAVMDAVVAGLVKETESAPSGDPMWDEVMAALRSARNALNGLEVLLGREVAELGDAARRQREATQRECLEIVQSAERDAERMMETARLRIAEMAAVAERDELAIRARAERYAERIRRTGEREALRETVQAAGEAAASMSAPEPAAESVPAAGSHPVAARPMATREIIKLLQGRPASDHDR